MLLLFANIACKMYITPMKIILSALNSRHTHSAIALAYLAAYWKRNPGRPDAEIMEFDINQTNESIYSALIRQKPDLLAFSTYIWSLDRILAISSAIKAALPGVKIVLGGPEASFQDYQILQQNYFIDFIIRGEGEETLEELLLTLISHGETAGINGISYQTAGKIMQNRDRELIKCIDSIPSPFQNGYFGKGHGFTYYEASRGCPSRCTYCLSSVQGPVRNHSIDRVKADLDWFFTSGYQQIRFADRTFNFDHRRAAEIISYIIANNHRCINFHFEFQADFLDEVVFSLLKSAPDGMFHLEIGVQSMHEKALVAVNRRFNLADLKSNVKRLRAETGCHLHLDLLGGLPFDSFSDFLNSLDEVWQLHPHSIQISLVKVLRGTPLQQEVEKQTIFSMEKAPYTVLRTNWLKADEALAIQDIGKLVEGIYNCSRFNLSLDFIVARLFDNSASAFFVALADFWRKKGLLFYNFSPQNIYDQLKGFLKEHFVSDCELAQSLLEHEFHLCQKVPAGDSVLSPSIDGEQNRSLLKVVPGLKCFWYSRDLQRFLESGHESGPGAFPHVYSYEKNLAIVPDTRLMALSLDERFVIASLQQKINPENFGFYWNKCLPDEKNVPEFPEVIEKLQQTGLLYDSREKNYRQVKLLIEQTREQATI